MTYKQLFYFTGHCLALDEHPQFREQIIELFADDALSLSKDATRNPSVPEREAVEGNPQPATRNPSVPEREAVEGHPQPTTRNPSVPERVLPEQPRVLGGSKEAVEGNIQNSSFNIQNFIQLCSDHLVIPAIYLQLKAHDILADLPAIRNPSVPERVFPEQPRVLGGSKEAVEGNRERNLQILKQIDDITAVLNKENIQPVFLKGTANLLDGLYSDVGERMIGDIDFLVREEKLKFQSPSKISFAALN